MKRKNPATRLPAAPATYHAELGENGVKACQRSKKGHPTGGCANCERLNAALTAAHRMLSKQAAAWCAQESALVTAQREVEVLSENCARCEARYPDAGKPQRGSTKRKSWANGAVLPGSR